MYEKAVDRDSACEKLKGRAAASPQAGPAGNGVPAPTGSASVPFGAGPAVPAPSDAGGGLSDGLKDVLFGSTGPRAGKHEGLTEAAARAALRSVGASVGREVIRGVLGSLLGGSRRH